MADDGVPSAENRKAYWEAFYKRTAQTQLAVPSQFAVFVQGELPKRAFLVDLGCGSGRDALFFSSRGNSVVGVDGADAAVDSCKSLAESAHLDAQFLQSFIGDKTLADKLKGFRKDGEKTVVYARFFLHAITEESELQFLRTAASLCSGGGLLAVEFRTIRDQALSKVTPDHYRRFIEPAQFLARAYIEGFRSEYLVEGFGFAKYNQDDAYVVRCLLRGTL